MGNGASSFVHLHTHTEFSLLDGASRITAPADSSAVTLIDTVAALGMPALAMTDHGAMFGALDFYRAARERGVTPILGVEAYVAPGSRFDRTPGENEERYRHLTILARNETGYRNLLRLVTDSHLEGFYHRPRVDKDLLAERAEGLIGFTGCLAGEVCRLLMAGQRAKALEVAAAYRDLFDEESFYVEVQDHGLPEQGQVTPMLIELAGKLGLPLVATNDTHYTEKAHARAHDVLLCIQQPGKVLADTDRLRFDTEEFYVKSAEEMRELFRELPEACDATLEIAESVEPIPMLERPLVERAEPLHVPRFDPPGGGDHETFLRELAEAGARERYGEVHPEVRDRLEHGIRVGPGRGSAAGSVVSYCLRITDLDPLRYGLIFERFLNPERKLMPDIDMDFDERRRDEIIRYVAERYGHDHVAQIITFQTIKGKQGIRDAARVLGFPASVGDRLCKMYPPALLGRGDRGHRPRARVPAPRGLGPRRRRGHRGPTPGPLPATEAVEGLAGRLAADRHAVRHAWGRGSRPAEDGLPGAPDPVGDRGRGPDAAGAGDRPGHRPPATRRRGRLRDAPRGRDHGGVPARGRRDEIADPPARSRPVRGPDGPGGPVPAGAAVREHARRVRGAEARPQAGHVPARRPRVDPGADLRRDRVPGAGHGDRRADGRLHDGPGRPAP